VGPRPSLPSQSDLLEMRRQRGLNLQCPGLTGLAQVRGRDFISMRQKVRYEQFYANKRSVALYFWVLGLTVKTIFSGRGVKY
jgi:O-antigen biosynthesis protein WbqP